MQHFPYDDTSIPEHLSFIDSLRANCAARPDAPAILAPGRTALSYAGLLDQVCETASVLCGGGLAGKRIGVALPSGPEMAAAFLSVISCAAFAPINPDLTEREAAASLTALRADVLLTQRGFDSSVRGAAASLGLAVIELEPVTDAEAGRFTLPLTQCDPVYSRPEDVAVLLQTSGTTTGIPKVVPLLHRNICVSAHRAACAYELTPADRMMSVMPMFHVHGLMWAVFVPLFTGGSVACCREFDATAFYSWMDETEPTWITMVPSMWQSVAGRARANPDILKRSRLRFVRSASWPLPERVWQAIEEAFGVPVSDCYGLSEAWHAPACNPLPPYERRPGSAGLAARFVSITDEQGAVLPPGELGEVRFRDSNIFPGYDNNPEANAAAFVGGWFRTGDVGCIDKDGYLYVKGRLSDVINRGGEKVTPRDVEECLQGHSDVREAAVFGVPDDRLGEEVAAAVVLRDGASVTVRELQVHCESVLAFYKVPKSITFVDVLPHTGVGKLKRSVLRDLVAAAGEQQRPESPADREVVASIVPIWCDILKVDRVPDRASWLDLGGDSLLAARMLTRLEKCLGVTMSLATFLGEPTVAGLARAVAGAGPPKLPGADVDSILADMESLSEAEIRSLLGEGPTGEGDQP